MDAYKKAGVDVEAGYKSVELMREHVKKTFTSGVLGNIGGFGGLFEIKDSFNEPVLVSGTDGVGTKLKIAFILDKHDTIGQDCVAMCVNDIVCSGAKPLFFLDYIAVSKNVPEKVAQIVKGVSDGCLKAGCALIGGETAEMPGFYAEDEYDIAGFAVGIVEKSKMIDGSKVSAGDLLIGIASSGIHSNGYSLVRKLLNLNDHEDLVKLNEKMDCLGCTVGQEILKPTKIYVKAVQHIIKDFDIKAISHVTGGGFVENIPRMLPKDKTAIINKDSWDILPIFKVLKDFGNLDEDDLYKTFNMGIGMVMAVDKKDAKDIIKQLESIGEKAYIIGKIAEGENGVEIC